jgi:hypothetical protein
MKTIIRTSFLLSVLLVALSTYAVKVIPPGIIPFHVVITSKAYWDGPTKSCLPREKGGCCHIWFDGMTPGPGEIHGEITQLDGRTLQMTIYRKKGLRDDTWQEYFRDGKFMLDGYLTFDPEILSKLGLPKSFQLPPGNYPYSMKGDQVTVIFR